jgi:chromate transporter
MEPAPPDARLSLGRIPLSEAFGFWLRLGLTSFGGPAGQIALIHAELVERRGWVSDARFLNALNFCMLLPGPEAQQLATYLGWTLSGTAGGIAAGTLFVLPSALLLWILSWAYVTFGSLPWIEGMFNGLKPAILAVVAASVWRIGSRTLTNRLLWFLAGAALASLALLKAAVPWILTGAALAGFAGSHLWPDAPAPPAAAGSGAPTTPPRLEPDAGANGRNPDPPQAPNVWASLRAAVLWLAVWWTPVMLLGTQLGWQHSVSAMGVFFGKAALLTFGGAYAVLPYVAEQAVGHFHWLSHAQMLDGFGLAETTPGPLLIVLQYVGFLGGWNQHGQLSPLVSATLGAFISTWATFAPSFFWIFVLAPHVQRFQSRSQLRHILQAVTAAVIGLILHLALWLGRQVLFNDTGSPDWFSCGVCVFTLWAMLFRSWSFHWLAAAAALAAIAKTLILC